MPLRSDAVAYRVMRDVDERFPWTPPPMVLLFPDHGYRVPVYTNDSGSGAFEPRYSLIAALERIRLECPDAWRVLQLHGVTFTPPRVPGSEEWA